MDANLQALVRRETIQNPIVQIDEAAQEAARWVELQREPALGKVNLNSRSAGIEGPANISLGFVDQVSNKSLPRVVFDPVSGVKQAQCRRRDDGLFHRAPRVVASGFEKAVGVDSVTKRPARQSRQLPLMPVGKGNHYAIRRKI